MGTARWLRQAVGEHARSFSPQRARRPAPPTMDSVRIDRLDHLVLTVADIDATVEFYTRVLGMQAVTFGTGRTALAFGHSKINLHRAGHEFEPKAHRPAPGSADLCLIAADPLERVIEDSPRTTSASRRGRSNAPAPPVPSSASTSATRTRT